MKKLNTYNEFQFLVRLLDLADSKEKFGFLLDQKIKISSGCFFSIFIESERGYN